jgi:hypothetical protein
MSKQHTYVYHGKYSNTKIHLLTDIHTIIVIGLSEERRSEDEFQVIDSLMSQFKLEGELETKEGQKQGIKKEYSYCTYLRNMIDNKIVGYFKNT